MQWEQKWLAQQVKWDFTTEEREEMFLAWNIHRESKQRKLQLIKCLWSAKTLRCDPLFHRSVAHTRHADSGLLKDRAGHWMGLVGGGGCFIAP